MGLFLLFQKGDDMGQGPGRGWGRAGSSLRTRCCVGPWFKDSSGLNVGPDANLEIQ